MIKKKTTAKKSPPKKKIANTVPKKSTPKKKAAATNAKRSNKAEPLVTILQTAKCQSMSGKSTLLYNVGVDEEGVACIRINANSGGGYWSKEWVSIKEIRSDGKFRMKIRDRFEFGSGSNRA